MRETYASDQGVDIGGDSRVLGWCTAPTGTGTAGTGATKERAWEIAKRAVRPSKERLGATRAALFGSLARKGCFAEWSGVDIAARGISSEGAFQAINALMSMGADIEVNPVDVRVCLPSLLAAIEREGVEL